MTDWLLNGNAGTDPNHNFLGTTDNKALVIRTNHAEAVRIDTSHNVGIGTTTPKAKLDVEGLLFTQRLGVGTTTPRNPLGVRGTGPAQELLSFEEPTGTTKWHINQNFNGNSGLNFAETGVADGRLFIQAGGNVGIGTTNPSAKLNVDPGGPGGITIGNPSTGQGGFTSLLLDISAERGGFATIQAIQSSGTLYGNIGINASGGNVGIGTNTPQVKLDVVGDIHATGTKNFVQAHPTDPTKEIVYATLEGGEAGTYIRGTWKLDNGKAVIKLPAHFGLVTSEDGLTVQFTPRGEWLQIYVVKVNTGELVVQETQGKSGQFDYFIQGVRKGYEHHEVIQERK